MNSISPDLISRRRLQLWPTFDFRYELAGSGEDLHCVEQRVGIDDLTQHPQDLSQTLMGHGPLTLFTRGRGKKGAQVRSWAAISRRQELII